MKIMVLHGPNLNMLGKREPGLYGTVTLQDIDTSLAQIARELNVEILTQQTNHEGVLIDAIQSASSGGYEGIVINPGGYTHTSVALRDALLAVNLPFIEVHISNTFARERFRRHSYLSDIASGVIVGLGPKGYELALRGLVDLLC